MLSLLRTLTFIVLCWIKYRTYKIKSRLFFVFFWVAGNPFSNEDFLWLHEMEKTDAESIANFLKDIIHWLDFNSKKLRVQCYGGCTAVMGKMKGVATLIKKMHSIACTFYPFPHTLATYHAVIRSEISSYFQNHWKLHTKLLTWSHFSLNVIHIL